MKKYIIFVDGVCSLCNRLVNFVNKFDSKNTFLFSSLQGETFKLLNQKHNLSSSLDYVVLY
jgi:predicted DCC family thiol-disulfide oxidoreductase YuxK